MSIINKGMTDADGRSRIYAATMPGMAHFALTGPEGKTCRECFFWQPQPRAPDFEPPILRNSGKRTCRQYKNLMRGKSGNAVPHDAPACRYFEQEKRLLPTPLYPLKRNENPTANRRKAI